jgi:uncharacterized protein YozE (UPF0346 family)
MQRAFYNYLLQNTAASCTDLNAIIAQDADWAKEIAADWCK